MHLDTGQLWAFCSRSGVGRIRHLSCRVLWVQQLVHLQNLAMHRESFHICWSFYHFRRQHHVHKVRFLASEISRLFGDSGGLPCSRPDCIKLLKLIQGLVQVDYGSVSDMKEILFWNFHHARITFFCKQRHRDLKPCSANPTKTKITYSANNTGT